MARITQQFLLTQETLRPLSQLFASHIMGLLLADNLPREGLGMSPQRPLSPLGRRAHRRAPRPDPFQMSSVVAAAPVTVAGHSLECRSSAYRSVGR